MAQFKSNYLANAALNWFRGTAYPSAPAQTWIALFTVAPTARDGTGGTEVSGGSYARIAVTNAQFAAVATSGSGITAIQQIASNATLTFPAATASWGTIVGMALYDASVGGNFLEYGDLTTSQLVASGNTFQIPTGDLINQEK